MTGFLFVVVVVVVVVIVVPDVVLAAASPVVWADLLKPAAFQSRFLQSLTQLHKAHALECKLVT